MKGGRITNTKDSIIDNHERKCILIKRNETPTQEWLNVQTDKRVHEPNLIFWQAFPLTGDSVSVPIKYCKYLRRATKEDMDIALQNANSFAKEVLNQLDI